MNKQHIDFFIGQSTAGPSTAYKVLCTSVGLFASGVFDGAELKLQVNPVKDPEDDLFASQWYDHPDAIFTEATEADVKFWVNADLAETWIRGMISNPGDNTLLNLMLRPRTFALG